MTWLYIVFVPTIGFLIFLFGVSVWEKHHIKAYHRHDKSLQSKYGKYLIKVCSHAARNKLIGYSTHRHVRFKLNAAFWFTPDRNALILSGEGKIAGNHAKQTWLYSGTQDGRFVVTSDGFDEGPRVDGRFE